MFRFLRTVATCAVPPLSAMILLSACTGLTDRAGRTAAELRPALTRTRAERVLADYARRRATAEPAALAQLEADPLLTISTAKHRIDEFRDGKARGVPAADQQPTYYIPLFARYPKWFAAMATAADGRREAMVFVRETAKAPWRRAYTAELRAADETLTPMPRVDVDGRGYASAVATGASGLAIRPNQLPSAHASVNQNGSAAGALEPGPWTTDVAAAAADEKLSMARRGFTYYRNYHASGFPIYALRTTDGGALVWYSVTDEMSVVRTSRGPRGGTMRPPADMAGVTGLRRISDTFQVSSLNGYVAVVPPKKSGRARVIGAYGGPVGGTGR